jgi:hypothetical protein
MTISFRVFSAAIATTLAVTSFTVAADAKPAKASPSLVMVVPAQYAFVRAALDFSALRDVAVVSYMTGTNGTAMYLWNTSARQWDAIPFGNYSSGAMTGGKTTHLVVMGTDSNTAAAMADAACVWASDAKVMNTFDIVALVNTLNDTLKFTVPEWDWLSKRYSLALKDVNADRRRYGRYGAPKKAPAPPAENSEVVLPEPVAPARGEPAKEIEMVAVPPPPQTNAPGFKAPEDK